MSVNANTLSQLQPNQTVQNAQFSYFYQQMNLLIEMITFRLKQLSFTHRATFLILINSLYTHPSLALNATQASQAQKMVPNAPQIPQLKNDQINFLKHPLIYINSQYAMLKIISSYSGGDFYELLNSLHPTSKHSPALFVNQESEEINKAIVMIIARSVHLTCNTLHKIPS